MIADRAWIARNLGFNPALTSAPDSTFAFKKAVKPGATSEDFQREIIDFDSEGPEGMAFMAFTTATGLSRFTDIPCLILPADLILTLNNLAQLSRHFPQKQRVLWPHGHLHGGQHLRHLFTERLQ
jgi:hypothetical protein